MRFRSRRLNEAECALEDEAHVKKATSLKTGAVTVAAIRNAKVALDRARTISQEKVSTVVAKESLTRGKRCPV